MAESYEALVARIRYHIQKANFMGLKEHEGTLLLKEAADAIEELQKRVPKTPHGRLIDADALNNAFTGMRFNADGLLLHYGDREDWYLKGSEVETLITNATTIIESEGEA